MVILRVCLSAVQLKTDKNANMSLQYVFTGNLNDEADLRNASLKV